VVYETNGYRCHRSGDSSNAPPDSNPLTDTQDWVLMATAAMLVKP
jgi:hypothetical protein